MQKFFNYLILRVIHNSPVSNTSHHPHFCEEGKLEPFWLEQYPYILWKKFGEYTLLQKFGDWVSLGIVGRTHKQGAHLQGTNEKAEICMTRHAV